MLKGFTPTPPVDDWEARYDAMRRSRDDLARQADCDVAKRRALRSRCDELLAAVEEGMACADSLKGLLEERGQDFAARTVENSMAKMAAAIGESPEVQAKMGE